MKFPLSLALLIAGLVASASTPVTAKPPAKSNAPPPAASPTPNAAPDKSPVNPTVAWLLQQNGDKDSITLPLGEVLHTATGAKIVPFDSANPSDKAFLAHLGEVMDRVLPRMNRPDSLAHEAARLAGPQEIATQIEDEIAIQFSQTQDAGSISRRYYPTLRLFDAASGKMYFLAVALYPPGDRQEMARRAIIERAFRIDPAESKFMIHGGGCCLFVGVEDNGKFGNEIAFLNWDVTDISNLPIHATITFDASSADIYHPGAVLTDGRKGSD